MADAVPRVAVAVRPRAENGNGHGTGTSEAGHTVASSDDGAPSEAGSFRHSLSRGRRHGERVSFLAASPIEEFVSKYQVVKVSWRGKYERIFALAPTRFCTIDPSDFEVTNTWSLTALNGINLEAGDQQGFTLVLKGAKKDEQLKLRCRFRSRLLSDLYRLQDLFLQRTPKQGSQYQCTKWSRKGTTFTCVVEIGTDGISCLSDDGTARSKYLYTDMEHMTTLTDSSEGFAIGYSGRSRLFFSSQRQLILRRIQSAAEAIGCVIKARANVTSTTIKEERTAYGSTYGDPFVQFPVRKVTSKYGNPVARFLSVHEKALVELDECGKVVACHEFHQIYVLVRDPNSQEQFDVQFVNGETRKYTSPDRDGVLAAIYDISVTCEQNTQLFISCVVNERGLRLLPFFALEDATETHSFFKDTSIASCYLQRMASVGKAGSSVVNAGDRSFLEIVAEFNANVPASGIAYNTKQSTVTDALRPIVAQLYYAGKTKPIATRAAATLLQALFRIAPSYYGFREICQVGQIADALTNLLVNGNEFVVFWATLLLRRLTVHDIPSSTKLDKSSINFCEEVESYNKKLLLGNSYFVQSLLNHLAGVDVEPSNAHHVSKKDTVGPLVVMGLLQTLEGCLCSRRSTTSHVEFHQLVEEVAKYYSTLLKILFQSRCATTVEACTLLLKTTLEECDPVVASQIRDAALTEGIVLRHLYQSMFDDSFEQRTVSRYLISLWMSHHETSKQLLSRIIPKGFLQFLSEPPRSAAEHTEFDRIEREILQREREERQDSNDVEGLSFRSDVAIREELAELFGGDGVDSIHGSVHSPSQESGGLSNSVGTLGESPELEQPIERGLSDSPGDPPIIPPDHRDSFDTPIENDQSRARMLKKLQSSVLHATSTKDIMRDGSTSKRRSSRVIPGRIRKRDIALGFITSTLLLKDKSGQSEARNSHKASKHRMMHSHRGQENFRLLFHQLSLDHESVQLIWTKLSRSELRHALLAEIKRFSRFQISQGRMKARWNHEDFHVAYPSLADEIVVGGCYLRVLANIHSKVSFFGTAALEDAFVEFTPDQVQVRHPKEVLGALYCRLLRENVRAEHHDDTATALMCAKSIGIVATAYTRHRDAVDFDEVTYLAVLIRETVHFSILEDLLHTIRALCLSPVNAKRILRSGESMDLVTRLLQLIHSMERQEATSGATKALWILETEQGDAVSCANVSELRQKHEEQALDVKTLWVRRQADPACETSSAKTKLMDVPQLRWQLGLQGTAHSLQIAHDAVSILLSVARSNGIAEEAAGWGNEPDRSPVFPLPQGMTTMWTHTRKVIPLLLRRDSPVLSTKVATLLEAVYQRIGELQGAEASNVGRLFQWGLFHMLLASEFADTTPAAALMKWIHRLQNGFDGASALGDILPQAMIELLDAASSAEFSSVLLEGCKSPKVIWDVEMRRHLQRCCREHFEDYVAVLEEDVTAEWNYCSMAPIAFKELSDELWCGGVYLGSFCEHPEFVVGDPLAFMGELSKAWRLEVSRMGSPLSSERARQILRAEKDECDDMALRGKFKSQAAQLRDASMFASQRTERMRELNEAYKVLTIPRRSLITPGHDPVNLLLILNSMVVTCNRYADALNLYEFDGYGLLLQLLSSHCTADGSPSEDASEQQVKEISVCAAELLFNTCAVSVINGDLLMQQRDLFVLERVVNFCVSKIVDEASGPQEWVLEVCFYVLQTITGLAASSRGCEWIAATNTLAADMVTILWVWVHSESKSFLLSKLAQQVLESISRASGLEKIQDLFVRSGVLWQLILLTSKYNVALDDATVLARLDSDVGSVKEDFSKMADEVQNMLAIMAVRSLCRLGGFFVEGSELCSPKNALVKTVVDALLTPNLSELLLLPSHHEFLKLLHGDCESYTLYWNEKMRQEMLTFVALKTQEPPSVVDDEDYADAVRFRFDFLGDLFYVGGLYIETLMSSLFVLQQNPVPASDPTLGLGSKFFHELFLFIDNGELVCPRIVHRDGQEEVLPPYAGWRIDTDELTTIDRVTALNCLAITAEIVPELVEKNIVADISAMKMLLRMLFPPDNEVHQSEDAEQSLALSTQLYIPCRMHCISTLKVLSCMTEFGKAAIPLGICDILIELIHICRDVGPDVLEIIRNLCAHGAREAFAREILQSGCYLEFMAWMLLVEEIIIDEEFSIAEQLRVPSALILTELVKDGHPMCIEGRQTLCRFFPAAVVRKIAAEPDQVVEFLMADHQTPELVWNNDFRNFLRSKMTEFLNIYYSSNSTVETENGRYVSVVDSFEVDYSTIYPLPMVGNVYVTLFLQTPTYPLSDSLYFVTSLWDEFQVLFRQLAHMTSAYRAKLSRDDEAMVQRDIGVMDMVASALVCALQVNTWLLDKLAEMQIPENCCVLLNDTVHKQSCESCIVGVVRVLRVCSLSRACVESLEPVCPTLLTCLMSLLNPIRGGPLHFEAAFVLEIIRRIVSMHPEHGDANASNGIVFIASRQDLFSFLLNILESPAGIGRVKDPNIVRAEAIEILNMLESDPIQGSTARQILKKHKKWEKKYKFEPTDVVRNLVTEDPFLHTLFPEADRAIREYNRSAGRASERRSLASHPH